MIMITKQQKPTLVIDGDNLLHRAYWISKDKFINSKGVDTGVTYSGIRMVKNYVDQFGASNIYIAWDKRLVSPTPVTNFRKEILGAYKGNRPKGPDASAVHAQEDTFRSVLSSLGIRHLHPYTLEADDVIGWLSRRIEGKIVIISNDADLLQLINENVAVFNPIKKITVDHLNFKDIIGVDLKDYVSYRAIQGDTSDNIDGVRGYGPKKATKFILNKDEEIRKLTAEQLAIYDRNVRLMDLSRSVQEAAGEADAYEVQFQSIQQVEPDLKKFYQQCQELEFSSIINHFSEYLIAFEVKGR
jgi:DNA polymerase-1